MLTSQDVHAFLASHGIPKTATVLVHTSMRALGEVEGGCDGLIDAFTSYLSDGLFLVPTHTWANVGRKNPIFDVRSTPPCIGALPTFAAFRKDAVRSLHPTHSVAAFGRRAAEFVRGEEKAGSPCPAGGVWARLYDENATVLLLGVGLNRNTCLHAVDEPFGFEGNLTDPIDLTVVDAEGVSHPVRFRKHGDATGSENFGNYETVLAAHGALTYGTLGAAEVRLFAVRRGTEIVRRLLETAGRPLCAEPREIPASDYAD